jgi:hypothetical protein
MGRRTGRYRKSHQKTCKLSGRITKEPQTLRKLLQWISQPQKGKAFRVYLKVRFITPTPSKLPFDLDQLGQELSKRVSDELPITLSKNPHACQAVQADCVGWFFGSTKTIDRKTLVPAIRLKLNIPRHVAIGVQWRTIKNEFKKNYDWKQDDHPPQALHFDKDHVHGSRCIEASAKLWGKGSTNRVNGL